MTEDTWVEVFLTADEQQAAIIAGFLQSHGIPSVVEQVKFSAEPVSFVTAMAKIRVKVPVSHREEAERLIENPEESDNSTDNEGMEEAPSS